MVAQLDMLIVRFHLIKKHDILEIDMVPKKHQLSFMHPTNFFENI
jgi:hypothetical protein